jgi:hypothetical protein
VTTISTITHPLWRRALCVCAATLATGVSASALAASPAPVSVTPAVTGAPNELLLNIDPAATGAAAGGGSTPESLAFSLPRGMALDVQSRSALCTAAEASRVACPARSAIGFGHSVVHVTGYLFPGGDDDVVTYIRAFLGRPVTAGDAASVVLEVQLLGVERIVQAIAQNTGYHLPTTTSITGRVLRLPSGRYGVRVQFEGVPGGFRVPRPVTAEMTQLALQIGAVRFHRVAFEHTYQVETMNGPETLRVPDHRLVPHYLLSNPRSCPREWPFQLQIGFPTGVRSVSYSQRCVRGRVPQTPPPSPSAPERS